MTDSNPRSTASSAGSASGQVKEQARDKAQMAQDKTRGVLGQGRGMLRDQVEQRSTQAGEQIHATAQDVRGMAEQLRQQGKDTPARVVEQVADRAESLGGYLRDRDGEQLLRDAESFVRRRPWAVVAGGLALGFAASRLLKASSSSRYQARDHGRDGSPASSYAGEGARPAATARTTASTFEPASTGGSDYGTRRDYDVLP